MPDDLPRNGPDYDDDFYAWTQHQAAVLRDMPISDNRFDRENVVEEIESLGREQRDAVRSQVRRIIEHFLKLQYSPAAPPRLGWMRSINEARSALDDRLSATLRRDIETQLIALYEDARYQAELGLQEYGEGEAAELFPAECPYTLEQILQKRWYPRTEPVTMPDDLPRKGPDRKGPAYDDDFYAWTQHQAAVLREMAVADNRFDREHVVEEIEDLGKNVRNAVRSQVRRIVEHFLKLQYSPAQEPRGDWKASIVDARVTLEDDLTPTLRADAARELGRLYRAALKQVSHSLERYSEQGAADLMPDECPYTLDEVLREDWYPEPVEKP